MPGQNQDPAELARRVSKAVLGNRLRLEIAAAIARSEPDVVFGRQLATELGIPDNQVATELRHLAAAGLIEELPAIPGQQRRYFKRKPSVFWDFSVDMIEEIARRPTAPTRR